MKRILVTGAAGRVGSRLSGALIERGYEVKALLLPDDPNRSRLQPFRSQVEFLEGNLLDPDLCGRAVAGVDGVIHTANLLRPMPGMSESAFFDSNVRGTFNLLQAAGRTADSLERFVHFSSSAVYADSHVLKPAYRPIDEAHPKRPAMLYDLTKWLNEQNVTFAARHFGLRANMIRPSGIQVGGDILRRWTAGFVGDLLKAGQEYPAGELYAGEGANLWERVEEKADSPEQPCCPRGPGGKPWLYRPVDVRDVVYGAVCALEAKGAEREGEAEEGEGVEAFNIAAPKVISFEEAAAYLAEKTGLPVLEIELPVHWNFDFSIERARARLGYAPKFGLREMVDDALSVRAGQAQV